MKIDLTPSDWRCLADALALLSEVALAMSNTEETTDEDFLRRALSDVDVARRNYPESQIGMKAIDFAESVIKGVAA